METRRFEKEELWRGHVRKAREFPGGVRQYCASVGVSRHTFSYWKQKFLKAEGSPRGQLPEVRTERFIPVEIIKPGQAKPIELPDAKWLAEFIINLSRGGR